MDTEAISKEILGIRKRIAEIETERDGLSEDAFGEKADLRDEEHDLKARLANLRDALAEGGKAVEKLSSRDEAIRDTPGIPPV